MPKRLYKPVIVKITLAIILALSLNLIPAISIELAHPIKFSSLNQIDGVDKYSLLVRPQKVTDQGLILFIYLHGLSANCHEPFIVPPFHSIADSVISKYPTSIFFSIGYGSESWGNDFGLKEITNNTRELFKQFKIRQIVIVGSSMGGGVALNYAARAPEEIKKKILGVVAFTPAGDNKAMYDLSKHHLIKPTMVAAFGGTPVEAPETYKRASFLSNLATVEPTLRVCIISIKKDNIHPEILQEEIVSMLKKHNVAVVAYKVTDNQPMPPIKPYMDGLNFILSEVEK